MMSLFMDSSRVFSWRFVDFYIKVLLLGMWFAFVVAFFGTFLIINIICMKDLVSDNKVKDVQQQGQPN